MNRQISISKRQSKIRGIRRRLQILDRWINSFAGYFPIEYNHQEYWNYKIPILDILVHPPQTNSKIQRHCAKALIKAARHMLEARPLALLTAKITVLITSPNMFGSEICIFFDSDYFNSFFARHSQDESLTQLGNDLSLVDKLNRLPCQ